MHVGLGLKRTQLTPATYRFARQAGATHIVAFLQHAERGEGHGETVSRPRPELWTAEALTRLRDDMRREGLTLEAIENFEPADWHDVLLDGPRRDEQIETVRTVIRNLGAAGIPVMGYNFSFAGVWGRRAAPDARGGAVTVRFDDPEQPPIPTGMIWNQVYDGALFEASSPAGIGTITQDELWDRYRRFLDDVMPVAEEAGVRLALHPDDPPMPALRGTARLVHRPEVYDRVLEARPSPSNGLEFCVGTLSEMPGADIYDVVDHFSRTGRIAYVHLRNVRGTVPHYSEVFVDEGDTDMLRVLRILAGNGYGGVLIPDHTPSLECDAPWHAGMAYALGWMRAAIASLGALDD